MKFGVSLQNRGPASSPENLALVASRAESLGFDSAFVGDHIVIPESFMSEYLYSALGAFTGTGSGEWLEQLMVLTFYRDRTVAYLPFISLAGVRHLSDPNQGGVGDSLWKTNRA